jgi:hypothetical protein
MSIITRTLLLLSLLAGLPISAYCAMGKMPIIAYCGVPDWKTSDGNFRTFSECGFMVSLYPSYESLDLLVRACRYADKYGVKVIGRCPEMEKSPEAVAGILKKEPGFFGYMIQDEPSVPDLRLRENEIKRLKAIDSTHIFYINLHPFYHQSWIEPTLKVKTYPEYLRAASATSCKQISFDHYPVTTAGIRPTWYHNLEMVRQESLHSGKPFWGFVLSVPHDVPFTPNTYYPTPTLASLRLQIYSNLAYGAQAIQYFTYWISYSKNFNYHDAPIDKDGKNTKTYFLVQQMNRELKSVAPLFYGAKVLSVNHMVVIPEGTSRLTKVPLNLASLTVSGRAGAVVSQLQKGGHRYLAIVNKNLKGSMKVKIKTQNNVPRHITKQLKEEPMKTSYTVPSGDLLLFRLN